MATIKQIDVKMTFSVGLGDFNIPEDVFKELKEIEEKGITLDQGKEQIYPNAFEWLNSNIKANDAYEWEYEIDELSE